MANSIRAGAINGDPTCGLCCRMCIEVKRVYDGCRENSNNQTFVLELAGVPAEAVQPFTFVSAENYGSATFENPVITRLNNGRARIEGDVVVPIIVTFTDAPGNAYTATSTLRLHRSVVLNVPSESVTPYNIEVFAAFVSRIGNFLSRDSASVNGCLVIIIKVIVIADILVPTYGNCVYPVCENSADVCNAFFDLPLFP